MRTIARRLRELGLRGRACGVLGAVLRCGAVTRRARPGDNAAHEQVPRRYKAEVPDPLAADLHAQPRRTGRWRHDDNHHRPHEALG